MVTVNARRAVVGAMAGVCLALAAGAPGLAAAQEAYPTRPIEFIVPWGPGGGADQVARKAGASLEQLLKVSFPVVNVAGASGQTGLAKMLAAAPDGYTISIMTGDTFGTAGGGQAQLEVLRHHAGRHHDQAAVGILRADGEPDQDLGRPRGRSARSARSRSRITGFGTPDDITVNYFTKKGHQPAVGAVRQAGRALHRDPRRARRPALRAARRREELPREQADAPDRHLRHAALPAVPRRPDLRRGRRTR